MDNYPCDECVACRHFDGSKPTFGYGTDLKTNSWKHDRDTPPEHLIAPYNGPYVLFIVRTNSYLAIWLRPKGRPEFVEYPKLYRRVGSYQELWPVWRSYALMTQTCGG